MPQIAGVDIYRVRGQIVVMLLELLRVEGPSTRRGAADSIAQRGWFDISGEDWTPYPKQGNNEARWRTLVAWARKDALEHDLLSDCGRDNWQLSHSGRLKADSLKRQFEERDLDVRCCYMWRPNLKKFMCSTYERSSLDSERPPYIYRDQVPYEAVPEALWLLGELQRRAARKKA